MNHALILLAASGLTCTIAAASEPAKTAGSLVPTRKAGTLYINMATGERTLTRYLEDSNGVAIPEIDSHRTAALFDYWMSIDENPCWDDARDQGFAFEVENWLSDQAPGPITEPAVAWDYGDLPFDSKITGIVLSTATLATEDTDSNADGILDTGIDTVAVYYDALSEGNRTSIAPPTAVVRVESIPGFRGGEPGPPTTVLDYDIVLDFVGEFFELGDSDGQNLGSLWLPGAAAGLDLSALITVCTEYTTTTSTGGHPSVHCIGTTAIANPSADGLADFQYLQYYAQHDSNDKVTQDSTFIGLGTPEGTVSFTRSGCTPTITTSCSVNAGFNTWFTPGALPQGQSAFESFGIGTLGPGGDVSNIDWSPGGQEVGCCYWFGGLDCEGFLDGLEEEPPNNASYYNFTPYAQLAHGFFSDSPHQSSCTAIDFNADTFLDSGDISAFITLFLTQDPLADLNHDTIIDNGDISAFINLYLACVN